MTIFGEIPPLWQNLQSYGQFSRDYLVFNQNMAKYSTFFWQILYTFGQIFIDVNGQMLKNNLAIWPHCIEDLMARALSPQIHSRLEISCQRFAL